MSQRSEAITVEQLLALNEEIRALARAGVPLEGGLRALGGDLPGRLGRLAETMGLRLERGESLVDVLGSSGESFPPAYRAVVAAGLRSGRLPAALESISRSVRQADELRRAMIVGMTYPFLLVTIAAVVLGLSTWYTMPVVHDVFEALGVTRPAWYERLALIAARTSYALPWMWGAMAVGSIGWWVRSRRAARVGTGRGTWWPTLGAVRRAGRMATFSEVLATLVDQAIPLDEAVTLASAAGGGRELREAGVKLADAIRRGEQTAAVHGVAPLLAWLILTSGDQRCLSRALRHSAESYRRKAARMSTVFGTYLPIFLSAFIGGLIALYYAVLTMAPFYYLLFQLGQP